MRITDITLSDLLSYCTGDEFYLVKYGDKIYGLSSYRLGDKEWDYGIYGEYSLQDVEHGTCKGNIPKIFVESMIEDIEDILPNEYGNTLEINCFADLREVINHSQYAKEITEILENDSLYLDIADIWAGKAKLKSQNINNIPVPTEYELECIKKYIEVE